MTNVVTYDQPTTSAVAKNWDMLIERRVDFAKDDPTHRGHASMSAEDPHVAIVQMRAGGPAASAGRSSMGIESA